MSSILFRGGQIMFRDGQIVFIEEDEDCECCPACWYRFQSKYDCDDSPPEWSEPELIDVRCQDRDDPPGSEDWTEPTQSGSVHTSTIWVKGRRCTTWPDCEEHEQFKPDPPEFPICCIPCGDCCYTVDSQVIVNVVVPGDDEASACWCRFDQSHSGALTYVGDCAWSTETNENDPTEGSLGSCTHQGVTRHKHVGAIRRPNGIWDVWVYWVMEGGQSAWLATFGSSSSGCGSAGGAMDPGICNVSGSFSLTVEPEPEVPA